MKLFVDGALREAIAEEVQQVLNLDIFQQQISLWKPVNSGIGFTFGKNVSFRYLVEHIINPDLLTPALRKTVDKVVKGTTPKSDLFGFCVSTFKASADARIQRLKHNHASYTRLVQLDLDLKNEPDCTPEYVESVIRDIYEVTELGKHILLCGKSISRKGLYLYLQADTDDTEVLEVVITKVYGLLQKVFRFQNPDKTLDTSVTDITNRLRYYAPDPDLVINPNVIALDTTAIKVKKKTYNNACTPQAGNTFRELEIIRQAENRLLKGFKQSSYITGFHNAFLRFANACIGRGVSRPTLENYTQQRYGQLYNQEKRIGYLSELMRIIDCAEKNISRI
jgi:hypothetical protein